jgi:hypothetical protein
MADIEKPGICPAMQMFLHHPEGILHRHLVARERHHFRAERAVQRVEWCDLQIRHPHPFPFSWSGADVDPSGTVKARPLGSRCDAPSVLSPEIAIPSASRISRGISPELS